MLDHHNAQRAAAGVGPLTRNSCLDAVARAWAQRMAGAQSMTHNPSYGNQTAACVAWHRAAENVAFNSSLPVLLRAWMGSTGHRTNILDPALHQVGIGVAVDASGTVWAVVDFTD